MARTARHERERAFLVALIAVLALTGENARATDPCRCTMSLRVAPAYIPIDLYDPPAHATGTATAEADATPDCGADYAWSMVKGGERAQIVEPPPSYGQSSVLIKELGVPSEKVNDCKVQVDKSCSAAKEFTVVGVDLSMNVGEGNEETPGDAVAVNHDDDNGNGVLDKDPSEAPLRAPDDPSVLIDDNDLVQLSIVVSPSGLPAGETVTFEGIENCYEDQAKAVPAQASYPASDVPSVLYVEGRSPGERWIKARHNPSEARDQIKYTVVEANVDWPNQFYANDPAVDDEIEEETKGSYVILDDDDDSPTGGNLEWDFVDGAADKKDDPRLLSLGLTAQPLAGAAGTSVSVVWSESQLRLYKEGTDGSLTAMSSGDNLPADALPLLKVEGRQASGGMKDAMVTATYTRGDAMSEDKVTFTVVSIDMDVDSDRSGAIEDDVDDKLEMSDDYRCFLCVNDDDDDANDVPDCNDMVVNGPADLADMTDVRIDRVLPPDIPRGKVVLSGAPNVRIFKPNGALVKPAAGDSATAADLWPDLPCTLKMEGVTPGFSTLTVTYRYERSDGSCLEFSDAVKVGVLRVGLVLTDITGYHGIGSIPAASVPRIPLSEEPDGIACDGLDGVHDGARLLVRVVVSDLLDSSAFSSLSTVFGYIDASGGLAALPSSPKQEGEYVELTGTDEAALGALGLGIPGQPYEIDSDLNVLATRIYEPPVEFNLTTPNDTAKERNLNLAADVKLSGATLCKPDRDVALVRPPLVLVHGINSSSNMWSNWKAKYETDYGFVCKAVDHSGGSVSSDAPTYGGNGDIHYSYMFVRDGVHDATQEFRDGAHFDGKRTAVQKADIVAHSYGGLLSRWYVEQSGNPPGIEFEDRRDARKLITLGTPHRGAPVCNIMCEAYRNRVFFKAETAGASPLMTLGGLLEVLNSNGVRWHEGGSPPGATAGEDRIVPSLQVIALNSEVLTAHLNAIPFRDDVAYGSVVGEDETIGFLGGFIQVNAYAWLEPMYDPLGADTKSYFPWCSGLDGGDQGSDGIVPTWSQELPARASAHGEHHLGYDANSAVRNQVRTWLNDHTLPRGAAHRTAFAAAAISGAGSRANAYRGSIMSGTASEFAGVVSDSIVHVSLSKGHLTADLDTLANPPVLGSKGGIVRVTCTGMVRDAGRLVTIVYDGLPDQVLHENIPVPYTGAGDLKTFSVQGRIARTMDSDIVGPDGQVGNPMGIGGAIWEVGYQMSGPAYSGWNARQSPPSAIEFPGFQLCPPSGSSPVSAYPGNSFTLEGGVHAVGTPGGSQLAHAWVKDDDVGPDTVLADVTFPVSIPLLSFPGALVPYALSGGVYLYKDSAGHVAGQVGGVGGSSGESSPEIYQELEVPGAMNPKSENVPVSVVP